MAQIYKRSADFTMNISPKKNKPEENLDNFKLQLEKILQGYPVGHKNLKVHSRSSSNSRQNLIYLTGAPKKQHSNSSSTKPSTDPSDLSETDFKVLLQNFYKLEGGEQQILIGHLKKLESNKPELVEDLKRFVRVASPLPENEDIDASDCDLNHLNDLDDLDDILEEGEIITDSESDDDCILVSNITTKLEEDHKAIESTKNIIEILENTLHKNKKGNINLPKKIATGNKEFRKQVQTEKVAEMSKKQEIEKKGINNKEYNREKFEQNWKKGRRKFDYSISQEMQAIQFGYKNYNDMKEYLENTGTIYCGANYVSFSDN